MLNLIDQIRQELAEIGSPVCNCGYRADNIEKLLSLTDVINSNRPECNRCGYKWEPHTPDPKCCPACKSYKWRTEARQYDKKEEKK